MSLQFPENPADVGNIYEAPNGVIYYYDGTKWTGHGVPASATLSEASQDATAEMISNGVQSGITVTYHDDTNTIDLVVDNQSWSQITGKPTIPSDVSQLTDNSNIIPTAYTLPAASTTVLGGVKVGDNLSINNGVLNSKPYLLASTSPLGDLDPPAEIDISKPLVILEQGTYTLADAPANGTICYFAASSSNDVRHIKVVVSNIRKVTDTTTAVISNANWYPFDAGARAEADATCLVTAIYCANAWNVSYGLVNPNS